MVVACERHPRASARLSCCIAQYAERQRYQSEDDSHLQESFTASQPAPSINTAIHGEASDVLAEVARSINKRVNTCTCVVNGSQVCVQICDSRESRLKDYASGNARIPTIEGPKIIDNTSVVGRVIQIYVV
jgi:hypothetical protein